jgi:hypothetical protein
MPVGTTIPPEEIILEEVTQPGGLLAQKAAWLAPVYGGGEQLALVGIGARLGQRPYTDDDIYWLEDIADEIGAMIYTRDLQTVRVSRVVPDDAFSNDGYAESPKLAAEDLLSKLAYKPDPELVRCVEEGFRNFHDYSRLGRSPLAKMFGVQAEDHISCGKMVQKKLVKILEILRPQGEPSHDPLPRKWHCYTILHDAYVEEKPARDIMSKLYISEGTYYRTRRKALRGVTRALLEVQAIA